MDVQQGFIFHLLLLVMRHHLILVIQKHYFVHPFGNALFLVVLMLFVAHMQLLQHLQIVRVKKIIYQVFPCLVLKEHCLVDILHPPLASMVAHQLANPVTPFLLTKQLALTLQLPHIPALQAALFPARPASLTTSALPTPALGKLAGII